MRWCAYVCGYPILAGVGIGVVDVGYERRLANHLGAHRTPSILGVINGKVTFFHYAVAKEHLRQFVEDLLPQRLVERVNICLSSVTKKKKTQLQSIRGRKTKTFLYICQLNISYFLRIRITLFVSILGHWQEWPAVLEQLARAQQATRASVWPSACSSSVIQSKLSPCFNFMWKEPTLIALLIRAC